MQNEDIVRFRAAMREWFTTHARAMPWRETKTPYRVWVSEVMLQQTRVDTVIPFFERFLARFPNLETLAEASEDDLLKAWEGLGYYTRVRNLHKAARILVARGGGFPTSAAGWETLPGIGPYAAGAIASIVFEDRTPAVDGNVIRVLSRIEGLRDDFSQDSAKQKIRLLATSLLPEENIGDFNQSLMELGALICLPNGTPKCPLCPARPFCVAFREGTQPEIPQKKVRIPLPEETWTVLIIRNDRGVALRRRDAKGLLAGMWEFPNLPGEADLASIRQWGESEGLHVIEIFPLGTYRHVFTHKTWAMTGYFLRVEGNKDGWMFVSPERLRDEVALPAAFWGFRDRIPRDL